jgi:riboflavin kinase/FMN adenylyltransferase
MTPSSRSAEPGFLVLRDGDPVPARLGGAVLALGNFDGVHLGHQRLVATARALAAERRAPSAVLTFDPHPRAFFAPDTPRFCLTPEPIKLRLFASLGLDAAFIRRFDAALAGTSAADFVSRVIARELGASGLVVGPNFMFGRGREGTPALLRELARHNGLACRVADAVEVDGETVSSSRVRASLAHGAIETANRLLGYRWLVEGEVEHGRKVGRTLGYPTANLALGIGCGLKHGIYAVRVALPRGGIHDAVASFGRRPTFDNGADLLEVHLLDFSGDLYGRRIACEFVARIRGEERFDSAEALIQRMHLDAAEARRRLELAARDALRSLLKADQPSDGFIRAIDAGTNGT